MKIAQIVKVEVTVSDVDTASCSPGCNFMHLGDIHDTGAHCYLFDMDLFNVKNKKGCYVLGRCSACFGEEIKPVETIPITAKRKRGRPRKNV
jgi:hypothetical protein